MGITANFRIISCYNEYVATGKKDKHPILSMLDDHAEVLWWRYN